MKNKAKSAAVKPRKATHSLGELVAAISSVTADSCEAAAALIDLFQTGRVQIGNRGHLKRVRVCCA